MSFNSLHFKVHIIVGGDLSVDITVRDVFTNALSKDYYIDKVNLRNAGNTKFDQCNVLSAYVRAGGIGNLAAEIAGYKNYDRDTTSRPTQNGLRLRVRNAGPHKLRRIHTDMKKRKLNAPMRTGTRGQCPIFYTFERLLQLYFGAKNYDALVPARLKNWIPEEGSFWYHWFKDRD